jgi:uncharacterized protein
MLIEFRVKNHRSLRDEQVLTMEAGRLGPDSDDRPRHVVGSPTKILPACALYGPNASGKSNLLSALRFMRDAVFESQRVWEPDLGVPRDPFAWGPSKAEPSIYDITIIIESTRFRYGFVATDDRFFEEWLYAWPSGKKQMWFERDDNGIKFGDFLKGENKLIEEHTRPNALFLSTAVQLKHQQLQPIFTWFRQASFFGQIPKRRQLRYKGMLTFDRVPVEFVLERLLEDDSRSTEQQATLFPGNESLLDRFRNLLRNADFGIVDLRVRESEPGEGARRKARNVQLKHQSDSDDAWLPLEEESSGTQTVFRLGWPILDTLRSGGLIIVDELESSLHPVLAQKLVRLFNEPSTNPHNAQLIFTTHDTNLLGTTLGEPVIRRDQVWLTEKNNEGATELYPLTDYKPRKAENLERGYLQGRYGAIPFLGTLYTPED